MAKLPWLNSWPPVPGPSSMATSGVAALCLLARRPETGTVGTVGGYRFHQKVEHGYGACRSAALSAFLKVDNRHSFFIFMRDAIVQLCCCAFYKAFLTDPIGSSQELTLRATIAILGSVSSRQLLLHVHLIYLKREYVGRRSGTS